MEILSTKKEVKTNFRDVIVNATVEKKNNEVSRIWGSFLINEEQIGHFDLQTNLNVYLIESKISMIQIIAENISEFINELKSLD